MIKTEYFSRFLDNVKEFSHNWQNLYSSAEVIESVNRCNKLNDPQLDVDFYEFAVNLNDDFLSSTITDVFLYNAALYPSEDNLTLIDYGTKRGFCSVWFPTEESTIINLSPIYGQMDFAENGWLNFITEVLSEEKNMYNQ